MACLQCVSVKMSKLKAWMFNRKASSQKSKPDRILEALALQPGQHIADIGSGGGYFSLRFAEAVGETGTVYAVDIKREFLNILLEKVEKRGLRNIKTVLASQIKEEIPGKSLDFIFIRNAYHHLENRVRYFKELSSLLKPDGKISIVEYDGRRGLNFRRLFGHFVPQEKIVAEMQKAGYHVDKRLDFLPEQSFTIFTKRG